MSKKFSSPGQRRRRWIRISLIIAVIACVVGAWYIEGPAQRLAKAAIRDPGKVIIDAEITDLYEEEVEYRNLKGRKRYRTDYYAELSYTFNGEKIQEAKEVNSLIYGMHEVGDHLELWAIGPKHNLVRVKNELVADARKSPLSRSIQAAIFSGIGAYVLSLFLIAMFGREPDGQMAEGFYADDSWLDIEDHQLIAIKDGHLVQLKFDKSLAGKIQKMYQAGAALEDIIGLKKKNDSVALIPLDAISNIESKHYEDTFYVTWADDANDPESTESKSIEFLSPTMRNHALAAIFAQLEPRLNSRVINKSRLASARISLIVLALSLAGVWYFENAVGLAIFGLAALLSLKSSIARLWNPAVITELVAPQPS